MNTVIYEGKWETIQRRAKDFAHQRVRVTVLSPRKQKKGAARKAASKDAETTSFLSEFHGAWAGNDFEKCLESVYASRSKAKP